MENLSAEVGHKMRSAVKAKLVEMGSGGNSGYIDDELPDYVMIMVANKRSKAQMTEDLSLFLGDHTAEFVDWLHQVLQKLQEVAIPASAIIQKSKRKTSESKKDKKKKTRKSSGHHSSRDDLDDEDLTPPHSASPRFAASEVSTGTATPSITDVFAEHLIQKARTTQNLESVSTAKTKNEHTASTTPRKADDFDIPTMSQIDETTALSNNRRKNLSTLADLQKQINQAKKQLRVFGPDGESDDEDFINIQDDGEDLALNETRSNNAAENNAQTKPRTQRVPITFREERLTAERETAKKPIQDRLGSRKEPANKDNIISLSANRRMEKEIYVPVFRRTEESRVPPARDAREPRDASRDDRSALHRESNRNAPRNAFREPLRNGRDTARDGRESRDPVRTSRDIVRDNRESARDIRDSIRERDTTRSLDSRAGVKRDHNDKVVKNSSASQRDLREQVREKQKQSKDGSSLRSSRDGTSSKAARGMESRVMVAPGKPTYDEDAVEVPVNSVVKVQPRPVVPVNKQACKNLLLRAVAEAQRSTASVKPREESPKRRKTVASPPNQPKLFTKSYLDKAKQNIVIEVDTTSSNAYEDDGNSSDVEYVVENINYHEIEYDTDEDNAVDLDGDDPTLDNGDEDDDNMEYDNTTNSSSNASQSTTQFVVTLDDLENTKYGAKTKSKLAKKSRPSNGNIDMINEDSLGEHSKSGSTSSPLTVEKSSKVNKLIIKNDTDDEEEIRIEVKNTSPLAVTPTDSSPQDEPTLESPSSSRRKKRRHVSPIKFDMEEETASKTEAAPIKRQRSSDQHESRERSTSASRRKSEERSGESSSRVTTKRNDVRKKYENLPSLASTITSAAIDDSTSGSAVRSKSIDRCKYYPSCGKGDNCEFHHPVSSCKQFPNCKFGDQCLYFHPKCKFDLTCNRHGCNFSHSMAAAVPPLSSHVVPVTNYKSIAPLPTMCRFYPKCTNALCTFFHPKPCRFGRNCTNKIECNFYHFDLAPGSSISSAATGGAAPGKDKMKWFASSTVY